LHRYIVVAAKDRVLPSLQQGARLARLLPNAARVVFADSGHAMLLEDDFDLAAVMDCHGIYPPGGSAVRGSGDEEEQRVLGSIPGGGRNGFDGGGFEALRDARARSPVAEEDLDALGGAVQVESSRPTVESAWFQPTVEPIK
jgi:hypothetical protein